MGAHKRSCLFGAVALLALLLASCIWGFIWLRRRGAEMRPIALTRIAVSQATATTESELTRTYEDQVSEIIEDFQIKRHSLDFINGMSICSEITTGYYRQVYGYGYGAFPAEEDSVWMVVESAEAERVRVIEYTPDRFKAVARVNRIYDLQRPDGTVVEADLEDYVCGVYVFLYEEERWKLAGFFMTTDTRSAGSARNDWLYVNDELKSTIGALPDGDLCPRP